MRWVVGATLTMAAALGIGRFAYTPVLPDMVTAFGWSFAQAGDVASANFFGYMTGALLAPRLTASPQARAWFALSLMGTVLTTCLGAQAELYAQWLALRFVSGVASALCLVIVTTHLMRVLADHQGSRLGNVHFAGVGLGILVCMAVVYVPGQVAGQWLRMGLLAGLLCFAAWLLLRGGPWQTVQTVSSATDTARGSERLWRLIVGYGFFGFGYVVSATFVVAMAASIDASTFDAKSVWVVVGAALVPSVYVWQWLANRFGLLLALKAAYLVESVGAVIAGVAESYTLLFAACVMLGGTFGAITALGLSAARAIDPNRVAYAVSSMTMAFALGQLLGPAVSGRMADHLQGFLWPSLVAGGLLLVAALLVPRAANQA